MKSRIQNHGGSQRESGAGHTEDRRPPYSLDPGLDQPASSWTKL